MSNNSHNQFLSALSAEAQALLTSRGTVVSLPNKTVLFQADERPEYVYFLTSGVASFVSGMKDGAGVEVGMCGREGVVGAVQTMGSRAGPVQAIMQLGGAGLKVPAGELRKALRTSEEVRGHLLEYVQGETLILSQVAACHRLHDAEERLSRWLLMAQDRVQTDVLDLTQEFLADMLGSRRATVTLVAGTLQKSGLIEYHRGRVKILDRARLEDAACDCYRVIRDLRWNGNNSDGSGA
jgi:CRP-like cAMP-binding protein